MLPFALGCVKASFLFFYKRIFIVDSKSVINKLLTGLVIIVGAWSICFLFLFIFQCGTNFFAIWGSTMDLIVYCNGSMNRAVALCITDFVCDVIIICIPVPLVSCVVDYI